MKQGITQKLIAISCWLLVISCSFYGCKSSSGISNQPIVAGHTMQTIDLPVFIPDSVVQKQLYQSLFAAGQGKFYPCNQPSCDPKYKDLYLENPLIGINGNKIFIKVHIAGTTHILFVNAGISDDVTLTARPQVQNDTLYFRDVKLEHSSQDLLLNLTSTLFKDIIEQKIQQRAWYSFRPLLDAIATQAKKQFPIKYEGAFLLLDLDKIHIKSVNLQSTPDQGIMVDFSADLETEDSSYAK